MDPLNFTTVSPKTIVQLLTFSWVDYLIFFFMFGVSVLIGVYFGCFGSKQSSTTEYLLGSRAMGVLPVGISITASHLSGITLLGIPSEIYMYGTQYWACVFTTMVVCILVIYIYLPVFYNLKITSCYEYLKMRFDERLRLMALILYVIGSLLYIPIVIYIPALAFNQVTGIAIHKVTPIICGICIFYTTIGGLKAVVWSDTIQFVVTLGSMFTVFFLGISSVDGFSNIWKAAKEGDRLEFFNMDLDPTSRTTLWGIVIGMGATWTAAMGINPSSVQRFLAVSSMKKAKLTVVIFGVGTILTKTLVIFSGLIMYTKYKDCDPYSSGRINRPDQILPYFVLDVARNIPGLPGLFVSGIFSTALSTMSSHLNTLGGTIYGDFIKKFLPEKTVDSTANNIIKGIVVIMGILCVALVFVVEHMGGVLQVSASFAGVTSGPLLGLFTLGVLFPSVNAKGALYGSLIGLLSMTWVISGFQYHYLQKNIVYHYRPLSVEECGNSTMLFRNVSSSHLRLPELHNEPFHLYRVSFYWYPIIGGGVCIIIGLLISWLSKEENAQKYNKDLYSPIIHRFLPDSPENYNSVPLKIEVEKSQPQSYDEAVR